MYIYRPSSLFLSTPPPPHNSTLSLHDALPILDDREHHRPVAGVLGDLLASDLPLLGELLEIRPDHGQELQDDRRKKIDRKSTRLNSSHASISYAVFCLKKKSLRTGLCLCLHDV